MGCMFTSVPFWKISRKLQALWIHFEQMLEDDEWFGEDEERAEPQLN